MTDPFGRTFISYKSDRKNEIELLVKTLREHGIPTWQDLRNLGEGKVMPQLRKTLKSPAVSSAILWLTPEVANSKTIRELEIPEIEERVATADGFFVVPVAAGGQTREEAGRAAQSMLSIDNFEYWNMPVIGQNPATLEDCQMLAGRVLRSRLEALHRSLAEGQPLTLGLYTRESPPEQPQSVILDWVHQFPNRRLATASVWENNLLPALKSLAQSIHRYAPGRPVVARGLPALPAGLALGCAFPATLGVRLVWRQLAPPGAQTAPTDEEWSLSVGEEPSGFVATSTDHSMEGSDLAVFVSVNADVGAAVAASRDHLPKFRVITEVKRLSGKGWLTASQAAQLARLTIDEIRHVRGRIAQINQIHLFLAAPLGLAVLLGQLSNTLGPIQTYEYVSETGTGAYRPAALLRPSE